MNSVSKTRQIIVVGGVGDVSPVGSGGRGGSGGGDTVAAVTAAAENECLRKVLLDYAGW